MGIGEVDRKERFVSWLECGGSCFLGQAAEKRSAGAGEETAAVGQGRDPLSLPVADTWGPYVSLKLRWGNFMYPTKLCLNLKLTCLYLRLKAICFIDHILLFEFQKSVDMHYHASRWFK